MCFISSKVNFLRGRKYKKNMKKVTESSERKKINEKKRNMSGKTDWFTSEM